MRIRTKILATIGPACSSQERLRQLFDAGCDVCRVNFSHGTYEQHAEALANIRAVEAERGTPIGVLADLCGPKIRVGAMTDNAVSLVVGSEIIIQRETILGTADRISTSLPELIDDVAVGEPLLLDDGKIRLEVIAVRPPSEMVCRVVVGGILSSHKGLNLPSTQLHLSALTEKDRRDAAWIAERDFDYVALSFVQRADDIYTLRDLLRKAGSDAQILAKIEKPQALTNIDEILVATDALMVARGDLGVEMEYHEVPVVQKRLAKRCQQQGIPCVIATQMLESMITSPTPTRAEVSDVANAVLDHTDAVMLSGETAVGQYPIEAVDTMNRTVETMQAYHDKIYRMTEVAYASSPTTAALAEAAWGIIHGEEEIAAVAVYSATGQTARLIAKNRPACPILAFGPNRGIARRMSLYYGVIPCVLRNPPAHTGDVLAAMSAEAVRLGIAKVGERLLVVIGRPAGQPNRTNTLIIHTIEDA